MKGMIKLFTKSDKNFLKQLKIQVEREAINIYAGKERIGFVTEPKTKNNSIYCNFYPMDNEIGLISTLIKEHIIDIVPVIEDIKINENNEIESFNLKSFSIIKPESENGATSKKNN